jgi:uncharacterized protein YjgD (DUF1641 family)
VGTQITKNDLPTEVKDYIDALEERVEELDSEVVKSDEALVATLTELAELKGAATADALSKSDNDEAFATAISKADPMTRAVLESQRAEIRKSAEIVAKAEAERTEAVMVAKSAAIANIHSDDEAGVTGILKTAYGVSDEFGDSLFAVLKHADTLIEQGGLFGELGAGGGNTVIAKSVEAQAAALRVTDPTLSEMDALAAVYKTDPSLYEQAKKEG